ncbi:MAG TPA: amidohydrolase family protein [Oligoflexus sp.]|uniref:amidohydrolase family protein n=1 Tax=Oligoflexus sp. TaxID=1971216 RepID=UPI002D6C5AAD|nr:amidohydrolase family protein [Oligoflexus sp.]HYX38714.1 amidohydrolase family protein [Oligoflexus sp.]
MSCWIADGIRKTLQLAAFEQDPLPIPTQIISNGEFNPTPRTDQQKQVAALIREKADEYSRKTGLDRRSFLRSSSGMALAFVAMNTVYGPLFHTETAEAHNLDQAEARRLRLQDQFIFDVQLHFISDDYDEPGILRLRQYAAQFFNPAIKGEQTTFEKLRFENFMKEVYLDSDTKIGLLSSAPSDNKDKWFISNDELAEARRLVNATAGSKRLYGHFIITPGQPGWLDEIDRAIAEIKPDSWKGYTVGDPFRNSAFPYRLDDASLMYPAYEKMVKAGIRNVCIHKGLLPLDYKQSFPKTWPFAMVDDVGPAARDWPELNFIIYHSGLKPMSQMPAYHLQQFETTGRIDWVTDLAEIPQKYGVSNVYGELGTTFATSAVTHPRHAAGILGTLIQGMGADHVLWGTDSVWYGSPQWQIEAFRRIEMPEDLHQKFGFPFLGSETGAIKQQILGRNAARLYNIPFENPIQDELSRIKAAYESKGRQPSLLSYGYVTP